MRVLGIVAATVLVVAGVVQFVRRDVVWGAVLVAAGVVVGIVTGAF